MTDEPKVNEEKLFKLRNFMEDPSNQLKISPELRIEGDNRDQIYEIKNNICKAILLEDKAINVEISELDGNKVTM